MSRGGATHRAGSCVRLPGGAFMATFYYGGAGTDPLIRIQVTETAPGSGNFNVVVTQVQATDADAFVDPNGKYYLGDLRAFYLDFANPESFSITNFKGYAGYDA